MGAETMGRRQFVRRASGIVVAATAAPLAVLAGKARPADASGRCPNCGYPWGPLHDHLWATAPDFWWQDGIIARESNWIPSAKNPYSTASGLAQFLTTTWNWGEELFEIYGSPFDPYLNMDMMSAFVRDGQYYHWNL